MSHKFLVFPTNWSLESSFRETYFSLTGEAIQDSPPMDNTNSYYLVGSSRITEEQKELLTSTFPEMYISDVYPDWWVHKFEESPE
jgi:hypothetical protein